MSDVVVSAAERLRDALTGFDAGCYSGWECALIVEALAVTEKACSAARALAAVRAVAEGAHRERGFADGERWLARKTGSTRSTPVER